MFKYALNNPKQQQQPTNSYTLVLVVSFLLIRNKYDTLFTF